ncbi:MAG: SdpI family protein [Bacillota bacterium]
MSDRYVVNSRTLKGDWPALVLILGMFIAGLVVYPHLPEQVPSHFNVRGEIDAYSSRLWGAFGIPLLSAGIYVLMLVVPFIDPKRQNYAGFLGGYRVIRTAMVAFMAVLHAVILAVALGCNVSVNTVVPVMLGLLFIVLGRVLGGIRFNYFVGIRTPWTLADEEVWRRTHEMSGRLFVVAGLASVISGVLPAPANFWLSIGAISVAGGGSLVYSYFVYARRHWAKK